MLIYYLAGSVKNENADQKVTINIKSRPLIRPGIPRHFSISDVDQADDHGYDYVG
jgi:hypothetical protein